MERSDEIDVVRGNPLWIVRVSDRRVKGWANIKVVAMVPVPGTGKRFYSLGWNGERFAECSELDALIERHPGVAEMIKDKLLGRRKRAPGTSTGPCARIIDDYVCLASSSICRYNFVNLRGALRCSDSKFPNLSQRIVEPDLDYVFFSLLKNRMMKAENEHRVLMRARTRRIASEVH